MSEEPEKARVSSGWERIGRISARIVLYGLLLFVLLVLSSSFIWPWEFAFHVFAGPFIHAWKNLPPFFSQWRSALLPLACLVAAIVLAHRFIRWWITIKEIPMSWRWGHSAAATLLILLGSAAAIAMSGITHQAAWLSSSPWLESNHRPHLTIAVSNARQIMLALLEYEAEHERYPETLEVAIKVSELPLRVLMIETGSSKPKRPFIFLRPGKASTNKLEPVIFSPEIQKDRVVVGYSDGSVRTMHLKAWLRLRQEIQAAHE